MRGSQERVERDYPLSHWRHGVLWAFQRRSKGKRIKKRHKVVSVDECASGDEKVTNYQLRLEHKGRVRIRKNWVADVARRASALFGYRTEEEGKRKREDEMGDVEGRMSELEQAGIYAERRLLLCRVSLGRGAIGWWVRKWGWWVLSIVFEVHEAWDVNKLSA